MADVNRFDVVIVGAGIAGASLALALRGQGLRIALVEARSMQPPSLPQTVAVDDFDLRVSALTPRSRTFLEGLGVWSAITDYRCCTYRHMTVWDAQGTGQIDFDESDVGGAALGHIVENRAIVSALVNALQSCADVMVYEGSGLTDCERLGAFLENSDTNDPDSASEGLVRLTLANESVLEAQLVVAADGALSKIRDLMSFETREWDYGHRAIVATVAVEDTHQFTAWQSFAPDGPLALLPLYADEEQTLVSIVWSQDEAAADALMALDDAAFCAALGVASEHRLGAVTGCSQRAAFPLRQRHAIDYVQAGVALVGDAAHTIHPLAGQGINLGLQDVAALAQQLISASARDESLGDVAVLRRYQRVRKGDNLLMMAAMDGFKRLFEQPALPVRWLRNTGMRMLDGVVPIKAQIMRHAMGLD
ncbi:MAG: UbiH/UbiF/VisC/COQ6 family ubiquinone biosynthesis hydroxylase [Halioglobus sp.]